MTVQVQEIFKMVVHQKCGIQSMAAQWSSKQSRQKGEGRGSHEKYNIQSSAGPQEHSSVIDAN